MDNFDNPDPRGEYVRICPYCEEEFIANHMLREYCPEKNGKKDYCKNRYKRILMNQNLEDQDDDVQDYEENTSVDKPDDVDELNRLFIEGREDTYFASDLIGAHLREEQYLILPIDYLSFKGMNYSAYDELFQIPGTYLFIATYGPFAIAWIEQEKIMLTHKTSITWLTQHYRSSSARFQSEN
jgi:hypothetical protein